MSGDAQLKDIGTLDDICPYCSASLVKRPQRKTKCRNCGKFILVRTRPGDRNRVLVTERQAEEIEAQWSEIHSEPQLYISPKNGFDDEKRRLKEKFGREPSDSDVTWSLLNKEILEYSVKQQWGAYRNTLFEMGELLRAESKLTEALNRYLEVCYLDLNGPQNYGVMDDLARQVLRDLIQKEIGTFETDDGGLYPGVLGRVEYVMKKLGVHVDGVRERFLLVATKLEKALGLPVSAESAWRRLQNELFNE